MQSPAAPAGASPAVSVLEGRQGEVVLARVAPGFRADHVTGYFRDRRIPFFPSGPDSWAGLIGIDVDDPPSEYPLRVEMSGKRKAKKERLRIRVLPGDFGVQELTLPPDQVEPDAATLDRIERERKDLLARLERETPMPLWTGPFIVPVEGRIAGAFGRQRILNGQPRARHNGEDIVAERGTPVSATNDGLVVFVHEQFFAGNGVVIDHGLGLYSMYFHLDRVNVHEGQRVARGATIGWVGSTGRATGPHLHWGLRMNGARVNPFSLTRIEFGRAEGEP